MISRKARGMSSASHIQKSLASGQSGERRFYDSCKMAGIKIKKTDAKSDIGHIDFMVNDNNSYDVKGLKDSHKNGNILLELKNVQGKIGWCNNQNTPQWIAFDFGGFFLCCNNSDLYKATLDLCDLDDRVSKAKDCLYKGYNRNGRQDLMTMITLQDALNQCQHWFLPYQVYSEPMELL